MIILLFSKMASTLGQETLNTPLYTQLDLNHCHVMSELLTRYVLIGHPSMAGKAVKILRLACFAPAVPSSMDYNLRVYFVEDTPDALEVCIISSKKHVNVLDLLRLRETKRVEYCTQSARLIIMTYSKKLPTAIILTSWSWSMCVLWAANSACWKFNIFI